MIQDVYLKCSSKRLKRWHKYIKIEILISSYNEKLPR